MESMEILVFMLVWVNSIFTIGCLFVIYKLALVNKAKDLYELNAGKSVDSPADTTEYEYEMPGVWPLTANLTRDVTDR